MNCQTTFRELLKIPDIKLGNGWYKWRIWEDIITFECVERGGQTSWHLDTPLTLSWNEDNSGVYGPTVRLDDQPDSMGFRHWKVSKEDGMSVEITRPVTKQDCLLSRDS